ncbi:hypothetical protein Dsin_009566 [Dipteronia sinensis]|uniref:Uncharacterized protein n=1 Tax=Dipteronia sinensis TaxID=43782 RepID=A0AAE0AQW9_9ROSI|nr:hypothetical protein Dsin_009566 [Dipteronia sinensis]
MGSCLLQFFILQLRFVCEIELKACHLDSSEFWENLSAFLVRCMNMDSCLVIALKLLKNYCTGFLDIINALIYSSVFETFTLFFCLASVRAFVGLKLLALLFYFVIVIVILISCWP